MQIYDEKAYEWNHCVAPAGNLGRVDPNRLAWLLDKNNVPWYTEGWPYSSGLKAFCSDSLWKKLCSIARED